LLCDSLNDRYKNQPMMPRFGWLSTNDFPAHESVNLETSIRQAQTGQLRGKAATDIHSIAKEAAAVDETVADSVGPDIMSCDGPQPGCFYVSVRLFPGLLVSSPWKDWVVLPDEDVETVILSDARKWARENWDKVVTVVQKQSMLRMGTPPRREDEESEAVERLLAEALDREETTSKTKTPTKTKRSTEQGEGRAKLIAVLTKHHKYGDGGCLNWEPVGNNELARLAGVSRSTASEFFREQFGSYSKYRTFCRNETKLIGSLQQLNGELTPDILFKQLPDEHADAESDDDGDD
jgi:hypothetical protein